MERLVVNEVLNSIYSKPLIGDILKFISHFNSIIGLIFGFFLIAFFVLKEFFDINLFKVIFNLFRKKQAKKTKWELRWEQFYDGSTKPEFVLWQNKVLNKIYSNFNLLTLFGKEYPIIIHEAKENFSYPFKEKVATFAELKSTAIPEFKLDKGQEFYYKMMSPTIKRPNLIGFELDTFIIDDENKINGFSANVCQYRHNVVTSHILDYEMFDYYEKRGIKALDKSNDELLKELPYRKRIHNGKTQNEVITTGCNRHSLLSVQMLVVFKDKDNKDYRTLLIKHSKDVAIKPNYWQLIPAGGFEIFEKEETTTKFVIEQNFDVEIALFRELIEEALNGKDFEENEAGDEFEIINKHKDVIYIKELIEKGNAHLEFIGNVVDLISLRPELSFLLVIDTPEFADKIFKPNHEGTDLQVIRVNQIPRMLEDEKELLYPSSAGLLKLAMKSNLFKERGLLEGLN